MDDDGSCLQVWNVEVLTTSPEEVAGTLRYSLYRTGVNFGEDFCESISAHGRRGHTPVINVTRLRNTDYIADRSRSLLTTHIGAAVQLRQVGSTNRCRPTKQEETDTKVTDEKICIPQ